MSKDKILEKIIVHTPNFIVLLDYISISAIILNIIIPLYTVLLDLFIEFYSDILQHTRLESYFSKINNIFNIDYSYFISVSATILFCILLGVATIHFILYMIYKCAYIFDSSHSKANQYLYYDDAVDQCKLSISKYLIPLFDKLQYINKFALAIILPTSWLPFFIACSGTLPLSQFTSEVWFGILFMLLIISIIPLIIYKINIFIISVLYKFLDTGYKNRNDNSYANCVDFDTLNGYEFEEFCAHILPVAGFTNIKLTQKGHDQGVDITAYKDNYKYAIQCKRYKKTVGNKAVQEVVAGKAFYNCQKCIVMTNSYFTKQAMELAESNMVTLIDRDDLFRLYTHINY